MRSSTDLHPIVTDKNTRKKPFKISVNSLKAHRKLLKIHSRKSMKILYERQIYTIWTTTSLSLLPSNSTKWRLHYTTAVKKAGFPLSPVPSKRAVFLGGAGCHCFSSCLQLHFAEDKYQVSQETRLCSSVHLYLVEWGLYFECSMLRMLGP